MSFLIGVFLVPSFMFLVSFLKASFHLSELRIALATSLQNVMGIKVNVTYIFFTKYVQFFSNETYIVMTESKLLCTKHLCLDLFLYLVFYVTSSTLPVIM